MRQVLAVVGGRDLVAQAVIQRQLSDADAWHEILEQGGSGRHFLSGAARGGQVMPRSTSAERRSGLACKRPSSAPRIAAGRPGRSAGAGWTNWVTSTPRPAYIDTGSGRAQRSAGKPARSRAWRMAASPSMASSGRAAGNIRATQLSPSRRSTRNTPMSNSSIPATRMPYLPPRWAPRGSVFMTATPVGSVLPPDQRHEALVPERPRSGGRLPIRGLPSRRRRSGRWHR